MSEPLSNFLGEMITKVIYRHSLSVTPETIICPSLLAPRLSPRLSLSVCPAIKAYISVTMGWILMKLGESVGT